MNYQTLLSEGKIGTMTLKNRFVVPAMGTSYGDNTGKVTQQSIDYYTERAKGGFGLVTVEVTGVVKTGICTPNQPGLWSDEFIPGMKKLTDSVHKYGAKASIQLHHAGRQTSPAITGTQPVAPSAIPCPVFDIVPRPLTKDEIHELVEEFGNAALRAKKAGFDAVEVHGAHGYLVAQFLSSQANKRLDEYGGSHENRARFACEIIQNMKKKCGNDFPVTIRISGDEKIPGGNTIADTKIIAKYLEKAGADAIHVSICTYASLDWMFVPAAIPSGFNTVNAMEIKKAVSIPVIAVGRLNTPEICEEVLAEGKADFVSLGRESLADPEFPNKVKEGRIDEISPCIACLQACVGNLMDPTKLKISCLVNPRTGHEGEYSYEKAAAPKKVMVVGSGPAGLEAAWIAARRGHDVTVYEKEDVLGGQFRLAGVPPTKNLLINVLQYYKTMGDKYGVTYKMGTAVDADLVKKEKPDAVILAAGGTPLRPRSIKGIDNPDILVATDILAGKVTPGHNVLIIGGGMLGAETADYLGEHNRQTAIVEMQAGVGLDTILGVRTKLLERLASHNTACYTGAKVVEFFSDGVNFEKDGKVVECRGFDSVILAMGTKSNNSLEAGIKELCSEVYTIGDAGKVGPASLATAAAIDVACRL